LFEKDPEALTRLTIAELAELGGTEGAEIIMWLIMRGALSANVKKLHQSYYLPSMTGIATVLYENEAIDLPFDKGEQIRAEINHQLAGIENIKGVHPFTLDASVASFRINQFLHKLVEPTHRQKFLSDPETCFTEAELTDEEKDLIRRRDWDGLIRYGVIFFMLEKLGAVVGVSNLHIYAAMRGQTLEEFQKTRNAPNALYSVAGKQGLDALKWGEKK
jgi:gallate dioxygenase